MTHGSLFSGIGGFDLAAEWMGWQNIFHCEWNPFGQKVLKHYWPQSISYNDITKTDFTIHAGAIDILTGGFPCQPYSAAGKRLGKEDERHLWPEMCRAIREISPRYVVGENVRGLTNWNGGMVFDEVQADLEAAGYEVLPFLLPAAGVNAPHRRDRIWFVAYTNRSRTQEPKLQHTDLSTRPIGYYKETNTHPHRNGQQRGNGKHEINAGKTWQHALNDIEQVNSENTNGCGCLHWELEKGESEKRGFGNTCTGDYERFCGKTGVIADTRLQRQAFSQQQAAGTKQCSSWECFPTQSPVCSGDDGLPERLDGITFSKWRNESIKAYGNAIVPQVAYQIFKAIQQMEEL